VYSSRTNTRMAVRTVDIDLFKLGKKGLRAFFEFLSTKNDARRKSRYKDLYEGYAPSASTMIHIRESWTLLAHRIPNDYSWLQRGNHLTCIGIASAYRRADSSASPNKCRSPCQLLPTRRKKGYHSDAVVSLSVNNVFRTHSESSGHPRPPVSTIAH
jgi:hypothetical protein